MKIVLNDATYGMHPDLDRDAFLKDVRAQLEALSPEIVVEDECISEAADWPVILVTLGGLFLLGKPIKENLEAWIALAAKLRSALRRLREKYGSYRVDSDGASLLAISEIVELENSEIKTLKLLSESELEFNQHLLPGPDTPLHRPNRVYVRAFEVNGRSTYLVVLRSNGKVDFLKRFVGPTDFWSSE